MVSDTATSATTEPPVQAVQDLIDALATGGLDSILGPSKRTSASAKEMIKQKLGSAGLDKFVGRKVPQKEGQLN